MKKNQDYDINFVTKTITVSKHFREKASQLDSVEFKTMKKFLGLNMTIVEREIKRKPHKVHRWSYEEMENYIRQVENGDEWLADFEALKKAVKYGVVWSWFKNNFNPVDKKGNCVLPQLRNHKIVVLPNRETSSATTLIDKAKEKNMRMEGADYTDDTEKKQSA